MSLKDLMLNSADFVRDLSEALPEVDPESDAALDRLINQTYEADPVCMSILPESEIAERLKQEEAENETVKSTDRNAELRQQS